MIDSDEDKHDQTDNDSEEGSEESEVEEGLKSLEDYRLVDISVLNQNVSSNLVCAFCQGSVELIETERKRV